MKKNLSVDKQKQILQDWNNGLNIWQIAKKHSLTEWPIRTFLKKEGVTEGTCIVCSNHFNKTNIYPQICLSYNLRFKIPGFW